MNVIAYLLTYVESALSFSLYNFEGSLKAVIKKRHDLL